MNQRSLQNGSRLSLLCQHYQPVAWVLGIGVAFLLLTFFVIRSWEQQNLDKAFRLAAEDRATAVKSAFDTEVAMLELVRSSLISDGRVEREEFRETLAPFLSRSNNIQAVEWVPRVPNGRRAEYETAARRDGIDGFRINEVGKDGQLAPASRRDEYFPIYFIGPQSGDPTVYGFDLASEATRLESLRMARDTGKTVASGRIAMLEDTKATDGFLVYLPVYEKGKPVENVAERRKFLAGFILGVFRPNEMIVAALSKLQPEGIDVTLYDPSDSSGRPFHVHASRLRENRGEFADVRSLLKRANEHYDVQLDVGGHPWTIVCASTPEFQAAHRTFWAWGVLAVGLVFIVMVAGYLVLSIDHRLHLEDKVREQTADVRSAQEEVLCRLASASQWRDEETGMHIRRTGLLSQALARAANWFGDDLDTIRQAAPMHDIGKIGIPDAILQKPGKLSADEYEIMKTHTRIGAEILAGSKVPMLQMAREIALNHHERWDGKGYPRGLAGKDIPESARIVSIVDVYDALTHDRVNRPALPDSEAMAIMHDGAGTQFDPELLAHFMRCLPEMQAIAQWHPDQNPGNRRPASSATMAPVSPDASLPELATTGV